MVENPHAMQETQEMQVGFLHWEDPLDEETATHCRILALRIPGTEKPRDEGAWWAAIYGVTQSRTRLK